MDKKQLRRRLSALRRELPPDRAAALSRAVLDRLRGLPRFQEAAEVLLYCPLPGEPDLRPLLDELWARGARVLLPRCRPDQTGIMDLACPSCAEDLAPGAYGIPEPDPDACPALPTFAPDLALIPGLAFDRQGLRLGFGGGYYDRFLVRPELASALKVGVCFAFQIVDRLPADPWDAPVDAVCTDQELLWTPST